MEQVDGPARRHRLRLLLKLAGGGVLAVVLAVNARADSFSQIFVFLCLSWMVAILVHELAHAVAARIAGCEVECIRLGLKPMPTGPSIDFRLLGFCWKLFDIPLTGSVQARLSKPHRFRTRRIAMVAAGPLSNLLLAAAGGLGLSRVTPDGALFAPLLAWTVANSYMFLATAIPRKYQSGTALAGTDGHLIGVAFRLTDREIRQACYIEKVRHELEKGEIGDSTIGEAVADPDCPEECLTVLASFVNRLAETNDPRQTAVLEKVITHPGMPVSAIVKCLDCFLTRHLEAGSVTPTGDFDRYSLLLLEAAGQAVTALGTRGSVLIDLGRDEEGSAILEGVIARSAEKIDQCFAHVFLALVAWKRKDSAEALRLASRARSIDPACGALRRVASLLPADSLPDKNATSRLATPEGCAT